MHMADALIAPAVGGVMYAASAGVAALSIVKLKKENDLELNNGIKELPKMAILAALVFAGQMINFTIPGTGSSGHICGGMLLTALLGPYAGFLSMIAVLLVQCLLFADGGLLALGANIWNMAFYGCFVGYFLIWRPIMRSKAFAGSGEKAANRLKIIIASIAGCVISLQLGAFSVVLETQASGITELPFGTFMLLMQPIHLAIGLVEGLITAAVLVFINEARPEMLHEVGKEREGEGKLSFKGTLIVLAIITVLVGGALSLFASSHPDGLEWALFGNAEAGYSENMGLDEEDYGVTSDIADTAENIQNNTSLLPDYALPDNESPVGTTLSGIVGAAIVAGIAALLCIAGGIISKKKKAKTVQ